MEVEAEAVAYVLAGLQGLDTSAYSVGYIAGWADGDTETIADTAQTVLKAVHELADALAAHDAQPERRNRVRERQRRVEGSDPVRRPR